MTASLRCVIDTSVCVKQFISDPAAQFFVPDLFYIECANVLCKYVRANLYTAEQADADLMDLKVLQLQVTSTQSLMIEAAGIALKYGISAYDASYIALSQQVEAPLLTLDKR